MLSDAARRPVRRSRRIRRVYPQRLKNFFLISACFNHCYRWGVGGAFCFVFLEDTDCFGGFSSFAVDVASRYRRAAMVEAWACRKEIWSHTWAMPAVGVLRSCMFLCKQYPMHELSKSKYRHGTIEDSTILPTAGVYNTPCHDNSAYLLADGYRCHRLPRATLAICVAGVVNHLL